MTILVLGATGKTGRRVVARLRAEGVEVRAASRSGETRFDWTDRGTWADAVRDVEAVYLVASDDPEPTAAFVNEAVVAGVRRFVVLSGRGMDNVDGRFGAGMAEAERAVRASGAEWTILRANNFSQNFDEDLWHEPVLAGRLGLPAGELREPFVDLEDVAEIAVKVLTSAGHHGEIYNLSGPEALTFAEAVEVIAKVSGRTVSYDALTPAEYRAELLALGWPAEVADQLNGLFEIMLEGHLATPADDIERLLGRPAGSFTAYVERVWAG
ncbi:NAD-dependent epimerase/dehydratase family protein [Kribbella antibiotica]|uniref:NAD-dependent epimerase/dehydratase family protein n=1 Tax=Kribbella antibiotica TaxID=190195 RepID=A0A4R4ZHY0_9ACTN|nr:NAD(P)H-binding protein [Kribbella antibiotica]TDD58045.1 NAD-dependent epimerase/dehydratase family protein [Kribbella antibiotica]